MGVFCNVHILSFYPLAEENLCLSEIEKKYLLKGERYQNYFLY